MSLDAEREARRGLARLRRAVEKAARELDDVRLVLEDAEAGEFPADAFDAAAARLADVAAFLDQQQERLQEKVLRDGGIAPARLRGERA